MLQGVLAVATVPCFSGSHVEAGIGLPWRVYYRWPLSEFPDSGGWSEADNLHF